MNTQIKPVIENIEDFMEKAKNLGYNGNYTIIAGKFMYDLNRIKGLKIWEHTNPEGANRQAMNTKSFYMLDESVTNEKLIDEIEIRFKLYKIDNPNYYKVHKNSEYTKRLAKMMSKI